MEKAFFIDKDGTLVDNSQYPDVIPTDDVLFDAVKDGLQYLQRKGYTLFIVSNQSWIHKGKLTEDTVRDIFHNLSQQLAEAGIFIQDYAYCPHRKDEGCQCRKPSSGMVFDLAKKHNIDLDASFTVGDMQDDIDMGNNAGTHTILVLTGRGKDFQSTVEADYVINNLNEVRDVV